MLRPLFTFILFFIVLGCTSQSAIGEWRDYLSYNQAEFLARSSDKIYCGGEAAIFTYDLGDNSITRLNTATGWLNDIDISTIAFDGESQLLLVGYKNGNLDFVYDNQTINLPVISQSSIIGDKTINNIYFMDGEAWLSCGFGIVRIDLASREVVENYLIGPGGSQLKVWDLLIYQNEVIAATDEGIYKADIFSNLLNFQNWNLDTDLPEPNEAYDHIELYQNQLFVLTKKEDPTQEDAWQYDGNNWQSFIIDRDLLDIQGGNNYLAVSEGGVTRVYNSALSEVAQISNYSFNESPQIRSAFVDDDLSIWIADYNSGLVKAISNTNTEKITPSGPFNNSSWKIGVAENQLWIAPGAVKGNWDNVFNDTGPSGLVDGHWTILHKHPVWIDYVVRDAIEVKIDPFNSNRLYYACWYGGLLQIDNKTELTLYNEILGNAPISESINNPGRVRVGGIDFDNNRNLWMTNTNTEHPIVVKQSNGNWVTLSFSPVIDENSLIADLIHTKNGQVWCILPRNGGLFVLDYGGSIANQSDDEFKKLSTTEGVGGLPSADVFSIAEDLDGEIWVGTSSGPAVFYSPYDMFSNNPSDAQQILIEQDGNIQLLLETEQITAIAIDGANRKWFGTNGSGLFLMSEDGGQLISQYNVSNSPLMSNVISDIEIDPKSGEVFVATTKGVISLKSEATESFQTNSCINIFPNPVRENYDGPIAIEGLLRESSVKITDTSGNLVFETESNGGRAIWNGRNFNGQRVQTGVYFVLSTNFDGSSTCTDKILVIN